MSPRQIAHLDLDGFLIAVERVRDPLLQGRPVIIGGRPEGPGVVAAASAEARAAGVTPGLLLTDAAQRCPDAVFLEGAFQHYVQASQAVDTIVRRHCGLVEWVSLDEAYLDLSGRSPAEARHACNDVQQEICASLGVSVAIGMGSSKVVARVASRLARPRGLLYVLPGYEARLLAPLRLEALAGLDASATEALHAAGIETLGELSRLDPAEAAALVGRCGPVVVRHAGALDTEAVFGTTVPKAVSATSDVKSETVGRGVSDALDCAVRDAAQRLRTQGLLARTATLTARYAGGGSATRAATLREAACADDELMAATRPLLARLRRSQSPVTRLEVSFAALVRAERQRSLFGRPSTAAHPRVRRA